MEAKMPDEKGVHASIKSLFDDILECPICRDINWSATADGNTCRRCGYKAIVDERFISLLPDILSSNNQREANAYETDDAEYGTHLLDYSIQKPWNYPTLIKNSYIRATAKMAEIASGLGKSPSVLFVFAGGGMEAHISGLLGPNVVLADISSNLLRLAYQRFDHYGVPQPAALIKCDAERLPFRTGSFDLVIGFEGIHHCLVPQAALQEIWRVARRCSFIVDNLECTLTQIMFRLGKSSTVEGSGVKPNRFTLIALETMLYNANIKRYEFRPRTALPSGIAKLLGSKAGRLVEWALDCVGQANMFTLTTYRD
jgi:SAM-dependent methyltransferase